MIRKKDHLDEALERMYDHFHLRGEASCGDVTALWTGITEEENLLVYNNKTRKILYEEVSGGISAEYTLEKIAQEFAQGNFITDGQYSGRSAGRYGPNGLICAITPDRTDYRYFKRDDDDNDGVSDP